MIASTSVDGAIELNDARLQVRAWQERDATQLLDAVQESVASVGRWLPWCHASYGLEDAVTWIDHCRSGWQAGNHFAFAVLDARTGQLLGGVGLNQFVPLPRHANLGYWIRESCQRQGVATSSARRVARFGFETLGLVRIEMVVLPENQPSRAAAERIGARFEAIARNRLCVGDGVRDAAVYGLIATDLP